MFWADKIVDDIKVKLADKIKSGKELIVRDEKTASGRVHIGSMRGVAIHGLVTDVLKAEGIKAKFLYEINDFDPMDGLPAYLDAEVYKEHMGKPLRDIPSPDGKAKNFAEYFASEFKEVILQTGFTPEFYNASELYLSGRMNEVIKLSLENADNIRRIYKDVSGSEKADDWMPFNVICQSCGKIGTTKVVAFDGEKVQYICEKSAVDWAMGCEHEGSVSPFDGNGKLPWKVEWAAKFSVVGVDIEGAGKDHSTKGGSRDVASAIAREIFSYKNPYDIPYEFFLVGGAKMSSSKGAGSSAREIADLLPEKVFRLTLFARQPKHAINFEPSGDTVPKLFDRYDQIANFAWDKVKTDDVRLFELIHHSTPPEQYFLPRFSQVVFMSQMPHIDMHAEFAVAKGAPLTSAEIAEVDERASYAKLWLENYAEEQYKFKLQMDELPESAKNFSKIQKKALSELLTFVESEESVSGEDMHHKIHEIKAELNIEPKEFFSAIYLAFLGRESGPQAGWFLSVLDRDFLMKRLKAVS